MAAPGGLSHPHDLAEVLRTRDRHRAASGGAHSPGPAPLSADRRRPDAAPVPHIADARARPSRAVPDLTPAALQVFLC
ncbi:hypothetical protein [Streptomyces sp. NPDC046939]|uniref:hypothetical protein n=1 Tax=Streptomyces sp. NPDC046939 TaxID=3155376 RepID=UPI0033FDEFBD